MQRSEAQRLYRQKSRRMTSLLLLLWFLVTFGVVYFARELDFAFFGWPFSFWIGAQGALVVYLLIIAFYAHYMSRLDQAFGVEQDG